MPQTLAGSVVATTMEGAQQTIALGPVASQDRDQDARHQWRRLLQRQCGAPVRKSERLLQPHPDAVDLRARRGADLDVRQGGRQHQAGLGDPRRDAGPVHRRRLDRLCRRSGGQSDPSCDRASIRPAATWRARRPASASPPRPCSPAVTTAASCGAVNAMHDSFTPIGGFIPLFNMQLGEVIIGGVGAGLYGILLFAILAIFVAGLMVGRTPEYVGKKIEAREVKLAVHRDRRAAAVDPRLHGAGARSCRRALRACRNQGRTASARCSTPIRSATANNGSAFAGLTASNPFWASTLGIAMFLGRFFIILPVLAIAGSLAAKKHTPEGPGSLPDHRPALGRPARRPDPDPRRPHLPAQPRARTGGRSSRDDPRPALLEDNRRCPVTHPPASRSSAGT